jgi:bifunctional non-homologous end joining protein LigD
MSAACLFGMAKRRTGAAAARLREYHRKRDFARTPEPAGGRRAAKPERGIFVVQKHAARRLHYDFRLELDGVLLSWPIPKGPSLSPRARRLAVRTEDHPIEYADFEGIIPKGEYGGGTVLVWDRGTWEPEGDPRRGLREGKLTFRLRGEKLRGRWHLVRTGGDGKKQSWLLIKSRDDEADESRDIVAERPESVISGRTIEQVAAEPAAVWRSNRASAPRAAARRSGKRQELERLDLEALVRELPLRVKLTSLDKVLYPEEGITKAALAAYLAVVADRMLEHAAARPLTLVRCPEGRRRKCFFQKHAGPGVPPEVGRTDVTEEDGVARPYMVVHDLDGLVGLAQIGTLEIHTWGSRVDRLERPDLLVLDLDPGPGLGWDDVVRAALDVRGLLRRLDLESFVKTTGGKGLHVTVPIARRHDWDDVKSFTRAIAEHLARLHPDRYVATAAKARRRGKIFVDWLRNARGATFVTPYSPRARAGAPVATPITWDELERGVSPAAFDMTSVLARLAAADPWANMRGLRQTIRAAARRELLST